MLALVFLAVFLCLRRRNRNRARHGNSRHLHERDLPPSGKGSPNSFNDGNSTFNFFKGSFIGGGGGNGIIGPMPTNIKREQSTATTLTGGILDEKQQQQRYYDGADIVPIEADQRLDPGKVYMRWDHNDSRRSLHDEHDYSRKVLRVTNPDYGRA